MNNIALFVTHSVFLTKDQITGLVEKGVVDATGHCVSVWVDAGTGRTTEPGEELFCFYRLKGSVDSYRDVNVIPRRGYEIFLPRASEWSPPPKVDYEKMAEWSSERRMLMMSEIEKWWFSNPRPHDIENLKSGYMRFEVRKNGQKEAKGHPEHHVVEIADEGRLIGSLTS